MPPRRARSCVVQTPHTAPPAVAALTCRGGGAPSGVGLLLVPLPFAEVVLPLGVVLLRDLVLLDERDVLETAVGGERVRVEVGDVDRPPVARREVAEFELLVHHVGDDLAILIEQRHVHVRGARAAVRAQLVLDGLDRHVPVEPDLEHARLE
eukprot:5864448-Prymnesium_polylepis.1